MAAKIDGITSAVETAEAGAYIPKVTVFVPLDMNDSDGNINQTDAVTINGETTVVRRGEPADVSVPVFMQLRNKYPKI